MFILSADDTADLFLSSDATPANKRMIAQQPGWNTNRQWVSDEGGRIDLQQKTSSTWTNGEGATPYANGASPNVSNVSLADSGSYDCVVTLPNFANTLTSSVATVTFQPATFVPGYLKYEYFPDSSRQLLEAGTTDNPSFAGAIVGSDKSGFTTIFESGINFADNYGNRFSGFFVPPPTGPYVTIGSLSNVFLRVVNP